MTIPKPETTNCDHCGAQVSYQAENCEHCGAPSPHDPSIPAGILGCLLVGLGIVLGVVLASPLKAKGKICWSFFSS